MYPGNKIQMFLRCLYSNQGKNKNIDLLAAIQHSIFSLSYFTKSILEKKILNQKKSNRAFTKISLQNFSTIAYFSTTEIHLFVFLNKLLLCSKDKKSQFWGEGETFFQTVLR